MIIAAMSSPLNMAAAAAAQQQTCELQQVLAWHTPDWQLPVDPHEQQLQSSG
jgi:hypothetical protein